MTFAMTGSVGAAATRRTAQDRHYATFRVDDMSMGIELSWVQELLRYREMTSVPLAPRAIEGLINLRGQIVTALDLRRVLCLSPLTAEDALPMNIVIRSDTGPVSLLVDEVCDVIDVPPSASRPLPENLPAALRGLIEGVCQIESGLLLVLNVERVLDISAH